MSYIYESKLASYIEGLIQQKQSSGFKYHTGELHLKRIDTFLMEEFPDAETITYEVAAKWSEARNGESEGYHNSRMSSMNTCSRWALMHLYRTVLIAKVIDRFFTFLQKKK